MALRMGYTNFAAVGVEAAYGTASTPDIHFRVLPGFNPKHTPEILVPEHLGFGYKPKTVYKGKPKTTCDLSMLVNAYDVTSWLRWLTWGYGATVVVSERWKHPLTWSFTTTQQRGLTLEQPLPTKSNQYPGCSVRGLDFSLSPGGLLQMVAHIVGTGEATSGAVTTPTYYAKAENALFPWGQCYLKYYGGATLNLWDMSLSYVRGLDEDNYILRNQRAGITPLMTDYSEMSFDMTLRCENRTEIDRLLSFGNDLSFVLSFQGNDINGLTAGQNYVMAFYLFDLILDDVDLPTEGFSEVKQRLTGKAYHSRSFGGNTIFEVTNDTADYGSDWIGA